MELCEEEGECEGGAVGVVVNGREDKWNGGEGGRRKT